MKIKKEYEFIRNDLDEYLSKKILNHEYPSIIIDPIKYIFINKGKKIRSILLIESCKLFGIEYKKIRDIALALECIHTYSLIHDDLPSMDDDDFRRGQMTLHKKYNEATAILVGDALVSLSFELLSSDNLDLSSEVKIALINNLAKSSGGKGMVGGQMLDLHLNNKGASISDINNMQYMKTGELFHFACTSGAIIGNGTYKDMDILSEFAKCFGAIFQISDDLIDIKSTLEIAGKSVGKDMQKGKTTVIDLLGEDESKKEISRYMNRASVILKHFGEKGNDLYTLCEQLIDRKS